MIEQEQPAPQAAPRPFLLYGDSPLLPSGLGRILRDVASRLVAREELLNIRVATVGVSEPAGLDWASWPHFRFQPTWEDQGELQVQAALKWLQDEGASGDPILLVIFDPSRAFALLEARDKGILPAALEIWGYFPIDGHPVGEIIGGPAGEMIRRVDRCLAYGRYGARILRQTRGAGVSYLPHGIEPAAWVVTQESYARAAEVDGEFHRWRSLLPAETCVVGVVATNQPRKDHPAVFEIIRPLEERLRRPVALWIHSDYFTKHWDFGELARIYGTSPGQVFVSIAQTLELQDFALAARYAASRITIAPGLGEGFGYPILESQACGTPVVHGNYAGGPELIPSMRWLAQPHGFRAEGIYGVQRPYILAEDLLDACERAVEDAEAGQEALWVAHARGFSWEHVWPAWESWIRKGLATPPKGWTAIEEQQIHVTR